MEFTALYNQFNCEALSGRYITNNHIEPLLHNLPIAFKVEQIGHSENNLPIQQVTFGTGKIKILMWSQMHGNESTTTKALFDLFNFLGSDNELAKKIATTCTLQIIPILNPDGALAYTRVNANAVDLNRDSVDLSQKESTLLRNQIDTFVPDFCLNLHDQRTIFGTTGHKLPATVSFLAPSYDEDRNINAVRETAMQLIAAMNNVLQNYIPNQIGRFDDGFNVNCIGDMCTSLGIPTILFEAGHYPDDYEREETRKYIFISYLAFFQSLLENTYNHQKIENYLEIPENTKSFFDVLFVNFELNVDNLKKTFKFAVQYEEVLVNNRIEFVAKISQIDNLDQSYGHLEYDLLGVETSDFELNKFHVGQLADFKINEKLKLVNGLLIKQ
ncbi:peptidase M14 [Flavobacterium agricola]|uniref:Peptidase M14 n=1 Tax=Flavobacterium agricola TaxID=2870839 RepID=A0ABY6M104_9FLAO|nr:M14 metallopeptidase family protein [Flavobacterium agricola]UYW02201.1 peptidase M14 [Flavobacterium agricola]